MAALIRRLLLSIALLAFACGSTAATRVVSGMHAFVVPVTDASQPAREDALRAAMAQVLVRMTGSRSVTDDARARALLQQASGFVQQYAYREAPPAETADELPPGAEPAAPQLQLTGHFSAQALDAAVRKAGLPLWSVRRPLVLAAVTVEAETGEQLLDASSAQAYATLDATVRERGLAWQWPTDDSLRLADARDPASPVLAQAARSAGADYIFWAGLKPAADKWILEAELRPADSSAAVEEVPAKWRLRSREPDALLREALQRAADWLAQQHALAGYVPGGESIVGIWVHGVGRDQDYMRVQQYLATLPAIDQLSLIGVVQGALLFRASTDAGAEQLDRMIRQSGRLQAVELPPGAAEAPAWTGEYEYHYELR